MNGIEYNIAGSARWKWASINPLTSGRNGLDDDDKIIVTNEISTKMNTDRLLN